MGGISGSGGEDCDAEYSNYGTLDCCSEIYSYIITRKVCFVN